MGSVLITVVVMVVLAAAGGFWFYRRTNARIRDLSGVDPLTGLKSRRYVEQTIDRDAAECIRRHVKWRMLGVAAQESDLALLVVDLDQFAALNQKVGKPMGDRLLTEIGRALDETCRDSDVVSRWEADKFLVLARFTNGHQAGALAERLRATVAKCSLQTVKGPLSTTCCVGYAIFPLDAAQTPFNWRETLSLAEMALFDAKKSGRNRCVGYLAGEKPLKRSSTAGIRQAETTEWLGSGKLRREAKKV